MQPGIEPGAAGLPPRRLTPTAQQGLLRHLLGVAGIAEHAQRQSMDPRELAPDQLPARRLVALAHASEHVGIRILVRDRLPLLQRHPCTKAIAPAVRPGSDR